MPFLTPNEHRSNDAAFLFFSYALWCDALLLTTPRRWAALYAGPELRLEIPSRRYRRGFLLALWPGSGSIRIRSTGGIVGFPRLVYSPRYSRGGRRGRRWPSPSINIKNQCRARLPPPSRTKVWAHIFRSHDYLHSSPGLYVLHTVLAIIKSWIPLSECMPKKAQKWQSIWLCYTCWKLKYVGRHELLDFA